MQNDVSGLVSQLKSLHKRNAELEEENKKLNLGVSLLELFLWGVETFFSEGNFMQ